MRALTDIATDLTPFSVREDWKHSTLDSRAGPVIAMKRFWPSWRWDARRDSTGGRWGKALFSIPIKSSAEPPCAAFFAVSGLLHKCVTSSRHLGNTDRSCLGSCHPSYLDVEAIRHRALQLLSCRRHVGRSHTLAAGVEPSTVRKEVFLLGLKKRGTYWLVR